jgi:putative endonuclease
VGVTGSIPVSRTILRSEPARVRAEDGALHSSVPGAEEGCCAKRVPSYGWQAIPFILMFYTYILESMVSAGEFYRGHTDDLKRRLMEHNTGKCHHTAKYKPWKVKFYAALETLELARQFEQYLKSGSGHAFAKRHFEL